MNNEFVSLIGPLIGVLFVILLAYLGTKFMAQKYSKMSTGRYLKVIERVALGQDKALVLLTVNQKAYLLGVTGKDINMLCEFEEQEFEEINNPFKQDFSALLGNCLKKYHVFHLPTKDDKNENRTDR